MTDEQMLLFSEIRLLCSTVYVGFGFQGAMQNCQDVYTHKNEMNRALGHLCAHIG